MYAVNYPASLDFKHAAEGIVDVRNKIESTAATCPTTKIVLGGWDLTPCVGHAESRKVGGGSEMIHHDGKEKLP